MASKRFLNRDQLESVKGIKWSRWTLARKIKEGTFPPPIRRDNLKLWPEHLIDEWIAGTWSPPRKRKAA